MKTNYKTFFFIVVALILSGCGKIDQFTASTTGYSRICVDGVEYIQFTSGASVSYGTDGKIKMCSK